MRSPLPPRLRETLVLLLDGLSEKEAAVRMGISRHTVHSHVKALINAWAFAAAGSCLRDSFINGGVKPPRSVVIG